MATTDIERRHRAARDRRDPRPVDGRGAAGELRAPRHADGAGARSPTCCGPASCATTPPTRLARPRPVRALERSRVDAALLAALPHRASGSRSTTSRDFRQWGSQDRRAPRVPPRRRHRGHDRSARSGLRQRRRHRARRGQPARPVRRGGRRPPHVRVLRRRRPRGGREPRGGVDRRAPRPRPARLRLRRQPHHHRRPDRARPQRRRARRFEGYGWHVVQLGEVANDLDALEARPRARAWPRPSGRAWSCCAATSGTRRRSTPTPPRRTAARSAPTRSPRSRRSSASRRKTSSCPTTCSSTTATPASGAAPRARRGSSGATAFRDAEPDLADELDACHRAAGLAGWERELPVWKAGEEVATRAACTDGASTRSSTSCPGCSCGGADLTGNTGMELKRRRRRRHAPVRRSPDPLRHPRARHGRGDERHGRAAATVPAGGTFFVFSDYMRGAVRLAALSRLQDRCSCGPTTRSASARTARPTSRSSSWRRCGRCPASG